jgi:hypothetical protein
MNEIVPMAPASLSTDISPGLLPARMLNEFAYCPRLCYLEWVQGKFADNADTVGGRVHHGAVDRGQQRNSGPRGWQGARGGWPLTRARIRLP